MSLYIRKEGYHSEILRRLIARKKSFSQVSGRVLSILYSTCPEEHFQRESYFKNFTNLN